MEKIISHIRPIDWTQGDVYGLHFRLAGIKPSVTIHWGDGKSETLWGNEIYARHIYPKDPSLFFIVEAEVNADEILYVDPAGGDCENVLFDFSQALSVKEIYARNFDNIILATSMALSKNKQNYKVTTEWLEDNHNIDELQDLLINYFGWVDEIQNSKN